VNIRKICGPSPDACTPKQVCTKIGTMNATPTDAEEFRQILRTEIGKLSSPRQIAFLDSIFIEPYQTRLSWEYGNEEEFVAWVFADLRERDVVAQYCLGGHGRRGSPWGINFRSAKNFGQDCGWYPSLKELIEDWGIGE
jgi:hypothetical protein